MANREKGEVTFEVGGKVYRIKADIQAWAWAQDALTKGSQVPPIELLTARLAANHMLTILAVFGGSLQKFHEHEVTDLRKATDLFERSNGAAAEALNKAIMLSTPDQDDMKELGVTANPPTAQGGKKTRAGAGETSASKRAVPA